jgi:amino acid adenylation domain-containing protein
MNQDQLNEINLLINELNNIKGEISNIKTMRSSKRGQTDTYIESKKFTTMPLSFSQQRFWWANKKNPHVIIHNMSLGIKLPGTIDIEILTSSLYKLVGREPILRTVIIEESNQPRQRTMPISNMSLPVYSIDISSSNNPQLLEMFVAEHIRKPFELSQVPLWKLLVIKLPGNSYQLVLIMHHIIADAATFAIFFRKLSKIYLSSHSKLDEDNVSEGYGFFEYCSAEQDKEQHGKNINQDSVTYWSEVMQDELSILNLPYDFPPCPEASYKGATIYRFLGIEKLSLLKKKASDMQVTLYMLLLSAFYSLLYKITNQTDIVTIGMFAGREERRHQDSFGCYANAVPLRFTANELSTFEQLIYKVKDIVVSALRYQSFPLQKIQAINNKNKSITTSPVFSTHFVLQSSLGDLKNLFGINGCQVVDYWYLRQATEFDLFLQLRESDEGISLSFEYSSDRFREETIKRFADIYECLIEAIINNHGIAVDDIDVISDKDKHLLLYDWNGKPGKYPTDVCYQTLFETQVNKTPDKECVICGGQRVTYNNINKRANKLAHYLRKLGVGPNVLVGLSIPRNCDMIISLLAILKAGGAYVPLDYNYPKERISYIIKEAGIKFVLSNSSIKELLPILSDVNILSIDTLDNEVQHESESNLLLINDSQNIAYTIFTSGSTGNPKGVPIQHRSLINLMYWGKEYFSLYELSGFFAGSSISFDASVFELLTPIAWGGKIILAENILHFAELPCVEEVTVLVGTPSGIASILRSNIKFPPALLSVVLLGEGVPRDLVNKLYNINHIQRVINAYGLTETTVHSIVTDINKGASTIPIGTPLPNTYVYILDHKRRLVPIGVVGEIYIGGDGLSEGFLRRPELTAKSFFDNKFLNKSGAKIYKTGDLGRYMPDGKIEYLGRNDFQVKIRGYRLELSEIELTLREHEAVKDCLVSVQQDPRGEKELIAYFTAGLTSPSEDSLKRHLKNKLPEFMVPKKFILLDELPISPNGKVDRKRFVNNKQEVNKGLVVTGNSSFEEIVLQVWKEVLELQDIPADSDFFSLGGHSLLVPQLQALFKERLGINIPIVDFFTYHGVKDFAKSLEKNYSAMLKKESSSLSFLSTKESKNHLKLEPSQTLLGKKDAATMLSSDGDINMRDIAIIGVGCRLPRANTPEEFWQRICESVSLSEEIPKERWDWQENSSLPAFNAHKSKGQWGVFLKDIDEFDASFFKIAKPEARWLDPQQRLLLEVAYETFKLAGYNPFNLNNDSKNTSVYIGASFADYARIIERCKADTDTYAILGNSLSFLSNRLSYTFDLTGLSMTLDTACSSSMLALYSAVESLRGGDTKMALAGGVGLMLIPDNMSFWAQMGILGQDKSNLVFDAGSSGFIPSEAVVCVLLKRYYDALRDGDNVLAIIKGASANQDGRKKFSIVATSPNAQKDLILAASKDANVGLDSISFMEAHGTGTSLGDPVEVAGLTDAFKQQTSNYGFCAIGATKAVYGHSGPAAGLVGLLKCIMALRYRAIPPMPIIIPNPQISFEDTPFYVNDRIRYWNSELKPQRVAISGLGFGGTNACFILEENTTAKKIEMSNVVKYNKESYWFDNSFVTKKSDLVDKKSNFRPDINEDNFKTYIDKWLYIVGWKEKPLVIKNEENPSLYIVFSSGSPVCASILQQLATHSQISEASKIIEVIKCEQCGSLAEGNQYKINPDSYLDYQTLFNIPSFDDYNTISIVYGWSMDNHLSVINNLFFLLKALAEKLTALPKSISVTFKLISYNSQMPNLDGEQIPFSAACWGLIRTARYELPDVKFHCIDLNQQALSQQTIINCLVQEMVFDSKDEEVAYINDKRFILHYEKLDSHYSDYKPLYKHNGVYLITGGGGGIGLVLGEWLVKTYDANVILFSRNKPSKIPEMISDHIWLTVADVTDEKNISDLVSQCKSRYGKINGVFHLAGVAHNNLIIKKSLEEFLSVLSSKIKGALVLDKVLKDESLDFMVFFSSLSSLEGNVFQCDYSAANCFLDSFASWRNSLGKRTLSINWGTWSEVGMAFRQGLTTLAGDTPEAKNELLSTAMGLDLLSISLWQASSQVIAANLDYLTKLSRRNFSITEGIEKNVKVDNKGKIIESWLLQLLANALELEIKEINVLHSFVELGINSILAVKMVGEINAKLLKNFPRTLLFIYPNIRELSTYLVNQVTGNESIFIIDQEEV